VSLGGQEGDQAHADHTARPREEDAHQNVG
jgi:hypothetical protein